MRAGLRVQYVPAKQERLEGRYNVLSFYHIVVYTQTGKWNAIDITVH